MKYLITVIFLWTTSYASDVCLTKHGVQGRCKGYADCPFFQALVTITPIITLPDLVQKYGGCGSWNGDTYLCCPEVSDETTCSVACSPSAKSALDTKKVNCKEGWFLFENSCYLFSFHGADWFEGRKYCLSLGSDYVKPSSESELYFLLSHMVSDTWIGLSDVEEEGTLKWVDGSLYEMNRAWWHSGQPDDNGENEDCIHFWFAGRRKVLNDSFCGDSKFFVCEMEPDTSTAQKI